ncbi:DNA-repair protein XRCC2 [Entomortierella parvispora]|uniref:DNA-repair protein XRCC2 n=1 Tax=Entomortierella parvispora TaxID=205924 RepID=A0A9P3LTG8_9FUNG|nr:DNA-repair protein XRCC2 [Entomortierella parvispora]
MPGPNYTSLLQIEAESGLDFITSLRNFSLQPSTSSRDTIRDSSGHRNHPRPYWHPHQHSHSHSNQYPQRQRWVAPITTTFAETGRPDGQPSARTGVSLGLEGIDPILERHGLLFPGDMVDIYGSSCSGKTLVLYAIIISTILPYSWDYFPSTSLSPREPLFLKGKGKGVLFIDMDQGFSVERLENLLRKRIRHTLLQTANTQEHSAQGSTKAAEGSSTGTVEIPGVETTQDTSAARPAQVQPRLDLDSIEISQKVEGLIEACLQNVHIFRPPDAISTIVLLRTMDQYLQQHQHRQRPQNQPPPPSRPSQRRETSTPIQTASIPGAPFSLLMLDSISSFYWQERSQSSIHHSRVLSTITDAFHRLSQHWDLVLISTSWSLPSTTSFAPSSGPSRSNADKTLTDGYRKQLKYRFLMQSRNLERFTSENELMEAWHRIQDNGHDRPQPEHLKSFDKRPGQQQDQSPQESEQWEHNSTTNDKSSTVDRSGSVFQAQMILPNNSPPEFFRISVSDREGVHVFEAPAAPQ